MPVVKHYEVKTIKVYPQTRGNVKASVLEAEPGYHNIIVTFVYDTKPVHFISTSTESISYIEKLKMSFLNQINTFPLSSYSIPIIFITTNIALIM